MDEEAPITFDNKHELRILNAEKFASSQQLAEKSGEFVHSKYHFGTRELVNGILIIG